jgi:hypothetical protein
LMFKGGIRHICPSNQLHKWILNPYACYYFFVWGAWHNMVFHGWTIISFTSKVWSNAECVCFCERW